MVKKDATYFAIRAAEELLAAECAASPEAERAHREMARRYSMRQVDLPDPPRPMNESLDSPQSA